MNFCFNRGGRSIETSKKSIHKRKNNFHNFPNNKKLFSKKDKKLFNKIKTEERKNSIIEKQTKIYAYDFQL